jgi:ADP-L-glycero-D-manno-heptose 6-epimerase
MIIVTGAQGFIGSCMVAYLNRLGINDIVAVDDVEIDHQRGYATRVDYTNLQHCRINGLHPISTEPKDILPSGDITGVFHFGAISDTLERDADKINYYNVRYTNTLAKICRERGIPMIFSSSAAVYGHGNGPVNQYAQSKLDSERAISDSAVCLRFFNVYGPNEYHKGRMSSVILKWYNELKQTGRIKIFQNSSYYKRDFIYVEDVCRVAYNAFANPRAGVYDLGTGSSESFETVADCVIRCFGRGDKEYIPMPSDLQDQYQRNTKANTQGVVSLGWADTFTSLSNGVEKYFSYLVNRSHT